MHPCTRCGKRKKISPQCIGNNTCLACCAETGQFRFCMAHHDNHAVLEMANAELFQVRSFCYAKVNPDVRGVVEAVDGPMPNLPPGIHPELVKFALEKSQQQQQ